MKPHIYISGPMTGLPDLNFPAFHEAANQLRAAGYTVTNPAELDAQDAGKTLTWEQYMRRDIAALMQCDGIATLAGWSNSRGATLEVHIATRLGMPNWPVRVQRNATHPVRGVAVLHGAGVTLRPFPGSSGLNPQKFARWPICIKPAKFCRQEASA